MAAKFPVRLSGLILLLVAAAVMRWLWAGGDMTPNNPIEVVAEAPILAPRKPPSVQVGPAPEDVVEWVVRTKPAYPWREIPEGIGGFDADLIKEIRAELATLDEPAEPIVARGLFSVDYENLFDERPAFSFSHDGEIVAAFVGERYVTGWNLETKEKVFSFPVEPAEMEHADVEVDGKYHRPRIALADNARYVAVGCERFPGVRIYEAATGKLVFTHEAIKGDVTMLATSTDGERVLFQGEGEEWSTYPLLGGKGNVRLMADNLPRPQVTAVFPDLKSVGMLSHHGQQFRIHPNTSDSAGDGWHVKANSFSFTNGAILGRYVIAADNGGRAALSKLAEEDPTEERPMWTSTFTTHDRFIEHFGSSADQKYLFGAMEGKILEIWPTEQRGDNRQLIFPHRQSGAVAPSPQGPYVVGSLDGTRFGVWKLSEIKESPYEQFAKLVYSYLENKQYDHLEALAVLLDREPNPFAWNLAVARYDALSSALSSRKYFSADAHRGQLKEWFEARPNSKILTVVRATIAIREAWEARGNGFANEVSEEGWEVFHEKIAKARELALRLISEDDYPLATYQILLTVAKAESWSPEQFGKLVAKLSEEAPWYVAAQLEVMHKLLPRWGGAPGAGEAYARKLAEILGPEEGPIMYARLANFMANYLDTQTFLRQENFDPELINQGADLWTKRHPDHPQSWGLKYRMAQQIGDAQRAAAAWKVIDERAISWSATYFCNLAVFRRARQWPAMWAALEELDQQPAAENGSPND